nr:hypothetical protein [uncultured Lachnoanaerobaculum sp.]
MTEIKDKLETDIIDNKKPLFEVSKDDSDEENPVYMVGIDRDISKDIVIDFDSVKTAFCKRFHKSNEVFKSADALLYSEVKNKLIFVEFKNGNVKNVKNLKEKLKDSLLVFSNIVDVDLKFCRKYLEYIVVYNYEKKKLSVEQKKVKYRKEEQNKSQSPSKEYVEGIAKPLFKLAKDEIILWDLEIMKDICVSDVHTYTVDEFVKYYSDNCRKEK